MSGYSDVLRVMARMAIMVAGNDLLRDDVLMFADRLQDIG